MATLTPIAGPAITVTALTAYNASTGHATFSGSGFTSLPTTTGVIVDSATSLRIAVGRIQSFA